MVKHSLGCRRRGLGYLLGAAAVALLAPGHGRPWRRRRLLGLLLLATARQAKPQFGRLQVVQKARGGGGALHFSLTS
jgi:hypothetical protein